MSIFTLCDQYFAHLDAHRPDKHTPMEEVVRAFNYLISSGQALYWGASQFPLFKNCFTDYNLGTSEWAADEIVEAHLVAEKLGKRHTMLL